MKRHFSTAPTLEQLNQSEATEKVLASLKDILEEDVRDFIVIATYRDRVRCICLGGPRDLKELLADAYSRLCAMEERN